MKKICLSILTAAMLTASVGTYAAEVSLYVNNQLTDGAISKDGRTMVPIRVIAENMGYTVSWNRDDKSVTITDGNNVIWMFSGNSTAYKNDSSSVDMGIAPQIVNGNMMIPVRYAAELLGGSVIWDGVTNTAFINSDSTYNWLSHTDEYISAAVDKGLANAENYKNHGLYYEARDELSYISSLKMTGNQSEKYNSLFESVNSNINLLEQGLSTEYDQLTYAENVNQILNSIGAKYKKGMYYEAWAQLDDLMSHYSFTPEQLANAEGFKYKINIEIVNQMLNKVGDYYNKKLYYEANALLETITNEYTLNQGQWDNANTFKIKISQAINELSWYDYKSYSGWGIDFRVPKGVKAQYLKNSYYPEGGYILVGQNESDSHPGYIRVMRVKKGSKLADKTINKPADFISYIGDMIDNSNGMFTFESANDNTVGKYKAREIIYYHVKTEKKKYLTKDIAFEQGNYVYVIEAKSGSTSWTNDEWEMLDSVRTSIELN